MQNPYLIVVQKLFIMSILLSLSLKLTRFFPFFINILTFKNEGVLTSIKFCDLIKSSMTFLISRIIKSSKSLRVEKNL